MSYQLPRSRVRKVGESVQAWRWSTLRGGPYLADPRRVRNDWLDQRLNLLPSTTVLTDGPVIDVGANIGDWTARVLRLVPGIREVVAIEPAPTSAEHMRIRFVGDDRVRVREWAASDSEGMETLHLTAHSHNSSLRVPRDMNEHYGGHSWNVSGAVAVKTRPLDSLGISNCSLIKIDVQGAEAEVLAGAVETLKTARAVLLEITAVSHYEGDASASDLDQQMRSLGFREFRRSDPWVHDNTGEPLWWDACYVPA